MPADKINYTDTLRVGTDKINDSIDAANLAEVNAATAAAMALTARRQLDTLIIENGTSDAEVLQARTDASGVTFPLVKDRMNAVDVMVNDIGVNVRATGAVGNGIADDSIAIQTADLKPGVLLFPPGTYKTSYVPTSLAKGAGATLVIDGYSIKLDDKALPVNSVWQTYTRLNNTSIGLDAGSKLTPNSYGNTAIGDKALQNNSTTVRNTAVGNNALQEHESGYSNTAIGVDALHYAYYSDRNTMVGATAGKNIGNINVTERHAYFSIDGDTSILDTYWPAWRTYAGSIAVPTFKPTAADDTTSNVGVGRNALGFAITPQRNVAIGYNALEGGLDADGCVAVGASALQFGLKSLNSVVVGSVAGYHLMDTNQDVFIGKSAAQELVHSEQNVGIGYQAMAGLAITDNADFPRNNVAIGRIAMANAKGSYTGNVALGGSSLIANRGNYNTALGTNALGFNTTGNNNTALGYNALNNASHDVYDNVTGVGANATVSGSNQVQLGNSSTTAYSYGAVQSRSDERDKADIKDTELGLEFINALRPVDYKWDYREDYVEVDEEGNTVAIEKDGSKKRVRYHHGLLAQEVKQTADSLGVDFGGFQDHSIDGGADVLSIGYEEMIAPLIKAVQELTAEVNQLKSQINA